MNTDQASPKGWRRAVLFFIILAFGILIFVVFSHIRPLLPAMVDPFGRVILIVGLLICALFARENPRLKNYWQLFFAGFVAALAMGIDYYVPSRDWLLQLLRIPLYSPAGLALDKLDSSIIIVGVILLAMLFSKTSLASIYVKKGRLGLGLLIGFIGFVLFAASSIFSAQFLFGARELYMREVVSWIPWILIFIIGNAFNEELLFRGLFLQRLDPFLGRFLSNLVIAIPFTLHHTGVSYSPDILLFFAFLLPLALAWGFIMQKTDSILGSFLFHAGTDIPVVLALFSALR